MAPTLGPALRDPATVRGLLLVFLGLAALAAHLALPVLWVPGSQGIPGRLAYREDLVQPTAVPYERHLMAWPVAAAVAVAVLGAAALALTLRPQWGGGHAPAVRDALLAGCGAGGFVLALTGARWLGFYTARLLDSGPTIVHLHVAPYASLAAGLAAVGGCLQALWPTVRAALRLPAGLALAACLAGLLLVPLLPVATTDAAGGRFHYDEVSLETLFGHPPSVATVEEWTWGRLLLDATAGVAAAALAWGLLRLPGSRWAPLAVALPLGGATAFAVRFYLGVGGIPVQATPWPNPLPLVLLALWAAVGLAAWRALSPRRRPTAS